MTTVDATKPGLVRDTVPKVLQPHFTDVVKVLALPDLASWPADEKIVEATQPAAIGAVLVNALHRHLLSASIAYLYRETMEGGGKIKLAHAAKASAVIRFLSDHDFVITVNWTAWHELTGPQRLALIDHELCHCGVDDQDAYTLIPHDVEEFGAIVRRWGLWKPDLVGFGQALRQLDLFQADNGMSKR